MSMEFENMVRCNNCMKTFHENEIIYNEREDKEFNFSEYYKNSEYYDGSKVIKNTTLKGIGKLIKSISV